MSNERINILRTAAIMAVLNMVEESSQNQAIGRDSGRPWAEDHRRMNSGQSSLMWNRSSRSTWR
ncbi:MAG: hypothetical protein CMB49_02770 [Euryarchaeota archaeon]|nr:hypothetical protein [Euryarchaeota archaeon]